jgi:hypothetical protein
MNITHCLYHKYVRRFGGHLRLQTNGDVPYIKLVLITEPLTVCLMVQQTHGSVSLAGGGGGGTVL